MNYDSVIKRSSADKMQESDSNILYGEAALKFYTPASRAERRRQEVDDKLLEHYRANCRFYADRAFEDWEYDDIFVVYMIMKDIHGTREHKNGMLKCTQELRRTLGAVNWCICHLFSEKEDLHRSNMMIKFRKEFELK
jgi:hypothetical protein